MGTDERTDGQGYSSISHTLRVGYNKVCTNQTKIKKKFLFWALAPFYPLYIENWVHILCTQLVIYLWHILFIFGMVVGHDVSMRILYRFHGWWIFVRVMAVYAPNWVCSCPFSYLVHIRCTCSDHTQPLYQI
jgi:hypothetical protein